MYLPYGQCMANYLEVIRKSCMLSLIDFYSHGCDVLIGTPVRGKYFLRMFLSDFTK